MTLDVILGSRLDGKRCLILVDVKGAETAMLEGAQLLLKMRPKPVWMMEIAISEHQPGGAAINPMLLITFDAFWREGYEAWAADREPQMVDREELVRVAASNVDTFGTHNFLFAEPGTIRTRLDRNPQDGQSR